MKTYEITYLTITEETNDAKTVSPILSTEKAKVVSVHPWGGRRKLAYAIKKQDQAFYTTVVFEAEPESIAAIDRAIHLNTDILRSLVVEFVPGMFHRAPQTSDETTAPRRSEAKAEAPAETATTNAPEEALPEPEATPEPVETPSAEAQASAPTEEAATPAKPRARRKPKEETDTKSLDEKLDELLKEDITK